MVYNSKKTKTKKTPKVTVKPKKKKTPKYKTNNAMGGTQVNGNKKKSKYKKV